MFGRIVIEFESKEELHKQLEELNQCFGSDQRVAVATDLMQAGQSNREVADKAILYAQSKGYVSFNDFKEEDIPALLEILKGK